MTPYVRDLIVHALSQHLDGITGGAPTFVKYRDETVQEFLSRAGKSLLRDEKLIAELKDAIDYFSNVEVTE